MKRAPSTTVRDLANRKAVIASSDATLRECAQVMRDEHVGSVVVVDRKAKWRPVGVITDRDIVVEAVAVGLDPATLTAGDVAATPVTTVREDEDILDALARMREGGVRRLPVVDAEDQLSGIVTLDDLLQALAEQLDSVARVISAERTKESVTRG